MISPSSGVNPIDVSIARLTPKTLAGERAAVPQMEVIMPPRRHPRLSAAETARPCTDAPSRGTRTAARPTSHHLVRSPYSAATSGSSTKRPYRTPPPAEPLPEPRSAASIASRPTGCAPARARPPPRSSPIHLRVDPHRLPGTPAPRVRPGAPRHPLPPALCAIQHALDHSAATPRLAVGRLPPASMCARRPPARSALPPAVQRHRPSASSCRSSTARTLNRRASARPLSILRITGMSSPRSRM